MLCPKCGSKMVERIAKKGKFSGKKFWGCSAFPDCRFTININKKNKGTSSTKEYLDESSDLVNTYKLNSLVARPISEGHEVYFFNTIGVSGRMLKYYAYKEQLNFLSRFSKFRVDFSSKKSRVTLENRQVFSLLLRLLNRGKVTTNSIDIENKLMKELKCRNNLLQDNNILNNYIDYVKTLNSFDSSIEKKFFSEVLPKILGYNWASHIMTQVEISSMIDEMDFDLSTQRVDFLISKDDKNIVVELDGKEHELHQEKDKKRDQALINTGYIVYRIPNDEVINMKGPNLNRLLKEYKATPKYKNNKTIKYHILLKLLHQIQIALVKALEQGYITLDEEINIELVSSLISKNEIDYTLKIAIKELNDLFKSFSSIYGFDNLLNLKAVSNKTKECITIGLGNSVENDRNIIIRDIMFKGNYFCEINSFDNFMPQVPDKDSLKYLMNYVFRFNEFKEGQFETISRVIKKQDSIVLLPTGSGKSLIYQITSFIVSGQTIVVSPITSLMDDQLDNLLMHGIDNAVAIYSTFNRSIREAKFDWMKSKNISLVYLSPERLQMKQFRDQVKAQLVSNRIYTVAIDEAHCVSEWGHDFRTAYLNIGKNAREVFIKDNKTPLILALTGTASTAVLKDVQREIDIDDFEAIITPSTFDRKELKFYIYSTASDSKSIIVSQIIKDRLPQEFGVSKKEFLNIDTQNPYCGIIFCPHVNGDYGVFPVRTELKKTLHTSVEYYSGSVPSGHDKKDWSKKKRDIAVKFKRNQSKLLVATKAFGMGIDKSNIRYTIHYGIPGSIESFYQEAGRAGRDRNDAHCIIVFSNDNERKNNYLLDVNTSLEDIKEYIRNQKRENADDVSRMLFFHVSSFKGIDEELAVIKDVIETITNSEPDKTFFTITTTRGQKRNDLEKAIQRLVVLGVINDYTVDYSSNEYNLRFSHASRNEIIEKYCDYVRGYNEGRVKSEKSKITNMDFDSDKEFIMHISKTLLEFIYDTIERGRRRGIREMVQLSQAALNTTDKDTVIRERVIQYFESTFSEKITEILNSKNAGFKEVVELFEGEVNDVGEQVGGIKSSNDAAEIRGQVSRELESTPDHPGLLFLRSLSELYSKEYNEEAVLDDFLAGIKFSRENYSIYEEDLFDFVIYLLKRIYFRNKELYYYMILKMKIIFQNIDVYLRISESETAEDEMREFPLLLHMNEEMKYMSNIIEEEN